MNSKKQRKTRMKTTACKTELIYLGYTSKLIYQKIPLINKQIFYVKNIIK